MTDARFRLEWHQTHVTLHDKNDGQPPDYVPAMGDGADRTAALLDLWTTLLDRGGCAAAIAYVVEAYAAETGRPPRA